MMPLETEVDNCPERVDAADAEAPRPPRIETAVEFWSGMGVETAARTEVKEATMLSLETAAVLTMRRFFWCTRKKIQGKTLLLLFFLPESCRIN